LSITKVAESTKSVKKGTDGQPTDFSLSSRRSGRVPLWEANLPACSAPDRTGRIGRGQLP
jgi:hypothetical protein